MRLNQGHNWIRAARKTALILLIASTGMGAYATLGDGKSSRVDDPHKSLLANRPAAKPGVFTLRSGYTFRGNSVINTNTDRKYISINTVVTMQKGNTTYILPMKKQILENVKLELGNRSLRRN